MKIKTVLLALSLSLIVVSCENDSLLTEEYTIEDTADENKETTTKGKPNKENRSRLEKDTYTIVSVKNPSPLYKYTVTGKSVLLQSNPDDGNWGTDYYGYWSNAFTLSGNKIEHTSGLSTSIYEFNVQSNGNVSVVRTTIVAPYQSNGETTTTVTNLGIYAN